VWGVCVTGPSNATIKDGHRNLISVGRNRATSVKLRIWMGDAAVTWAPEAIPVPDLASPVHYNILAWRIRFA
jgi:hypothetical protein